MVRAGTGKGTELFARLGAPMLCVEPDPRMAERLAVNFPQANVMVSDFDSWTPPAGPVPVLAGTLVWHLLNEQRRCVKAHSVLQPGGVVAIVGRRYGNADDEQAAALDEAFRAHGYPVGARPTEWIRDDLAASGLFTDVLLSRHDTGATLTGDRFLRLVATYSPFLRLPPSRQQRLLMALRRAVDGTGGTVDVRLETTLNVARRR